MRLALLTAFAASLTLGQTPAPQNVLQRYLQASQDHPRAGREQSMEVEIEASLPRLKKHGTMRGLKVITRAGQTIYTRLRFSGDRLVGKHVISRYLAADVQNRLDDPRFAISTKNYRFGPGREADYNGRAAQVFRLVPKHRRAGLFRGELWLDESSALPVREWGDFVKSPSPFLSHPRFVRDYGLVEDESRPRRLILTARAAFVGDVQMTIWFGGDARLEDADSSFADEDAVAASNP
jgi:hypothetical protein